MSQPRTPNCLFTSRWGRERKGGEGGEDGIHSVVFEVLFLTVSFPPPPLLLSLSSSSSFPQSTRNTVCVPRHWCFKRKYLQGKRGIEKPPFDLPDFIKVQNDVLSVE